MSNGVDQLLRQHGVQVTAQRLAVMGAVSSHAHATADDLTDDVKAAIGSISRQAVYDTLGVLVDKNLVRRIQPRGSAARYEDRVGDNHHHLVCRRCDVMFELSTAGDRGGVCVGRRTGKVRDRLRGSMDQSDESRPFRSRLRPVFRPSRPDRTISPFSVADRHHPSYGGFQTTPHLVGAELSAYERMESI
jgi:Fe2+ or Zn2+ uptake regulation protein